MVREVSVFMDHHNMSEGYITVAIGDKYLYLAKKLQETLKKFDNKRELYIIEEKHLDKNSFMYKSCKTDFERYGSYPKLNLHNLTPFDRTLFLDADILCASNPDKVWDLFKERDRGIDSLGAYNRNYFFKKDFENKFKVKLYLSHGGMIYINRNKFDQDIEDKIMDVWCNMHHYNCNTKLSYKGSRDDQLIHSIVKSLSNNVPIKLISSGALSFVAKNDTDHPRYKVNWYAHKNWYNDTLTFEDPIPFYHMFNKNNMNSYNKIFDKIINN